MTHDDEPRMTRAEWELAQLHDECATHGHHPEIFTFGMGPAKCMCGDYAWLPVPRTQGAAT